MKHKVSKELAQAVIDRSGGNCEICGSHYGCQIHHIVRRSVPPTEDNLIMLCWSHHLGTYGVHGMRGHKFDVELKKNLQAKLFDDGHSEEEVRKMMGGMLYFT